MTRAGPIIALVGTLCGCSGSGNEPQPPPFPAEAEAPLAGTFRPDSAAVPVPVAIEYIEVTLYFGSSNGRSLAASVQEIVRHDDPTALGREVLESLVLAPPDGYVSVFPSGTRVRGFYMTNRNEAFADFSAEILVDHPGGAINELLTVYAVVNSVSANLPAIERVQILVDGREVDTLAGHVDLRRPLIPDPSLTQ